MENPIPCLVQPLVCQERIGDQVYLSERVAKPPSNGDTNHSFHFNYSNCFKTELGKGAVGLLLDTDPAFGDMRDKEGSSGLAQREFFFNLHR